MVIERRALIVGLEAVCEGRWEGQSGLGKARLEEKELFFSGDFQVKIPLTAMTHLRARSGILEIGSAQGELHLQLGARAETWYIKIRYPKSRVDKLGVKPAQRVWLQGDHDADFLRELEARRARILRRRPQLPVDWIFIAIRDQRDLPRLAASIRSLRRNGGVWALWPKGGRDFKEDHIRRAGLAAGLVDVKVVSFSDRLSGLKFVIPVKDR